MAITIKDINGNALFVAENAADDREALQEAVGARANLARANLARANLAGAYLAGANLARANLARANLAGAKGIDQHRFNDLLILANQPGKIRAFKLVNEKNEGPNYGGIKYKIGETYSVEDADTDVNVQCGRGINLATQAWCMRSWKPGYRILIAEFISKDIAAIPFGDGKFRVSKCKIVGDVDLVEIGLVEAAKKKEVLA